jgi:luciferase family oxidoreductase group 1
MRLSVLDLGVVFGDKTPQDALAETRELVVIAEELGYSRYWLAEHHEAHYAWASPEIMIADLAPRTHHIRIGSAAVLLCMYSPLKVAEVFRNLGRLYPDRVDLGVCAGVPLDKDLFAGLLDASDVPEYKNVSAKYPDKVERLLGHLNEVNPETPEVWLQGSGVGNVILAARHGTCFSYSQFHRGSAQDPALIRRYRDEFVSTVRYAKPVCNIAVSMVCAEKPRDAERQKKRVEQLIGNDMSINISGTPAHCAEELTTLGERFDVDEIVVHSMWDDTRAHIDSYVMLAEVLRLTQPSSQRGPVSL